MEEQDCISGNARRPGHDALTTALPVRFNPDIAPI